MIFHCIVSFSLCYLFYTRNKTSTVHDKRSQENNLFSMCSHRCDIKFTILDCSRDQQQSEKTNKQ